MTKTRWQPETLAATAWIKSMQTITMGRPVISRNRRRDIPGATYYLTLATQWRRPLFVFDANVELLRRALHVAQANHPFRMRAYAIMPDHVHLLITLAPDVRISVTMQSLQQSFAQRYKNAHNIKWKMRVWQRGFWDHVIRDADDLCNHAAYIHYNPVKHGLARHSRDYPHTSLASWIDRGWYWGDWGEAQPEDIEEWELG